MLSLILINHNNHHLTQQCLTSLQQHTPPPYHLLLIDNASTDGTLELFQSIAQQLGPERVTIIRNEQNLGYIAACNQALKLVQTEFLVFLNNDTIVTPGWLESMHAHFVDPQVGLVGPMSNQVPEPQRLPLTDLIDRSPDTIAMERRARYAGQYLQVKRLSGFCLMARKAVFDQIGPLDEQFGIGFFDDDDLCFRAADVGWKLRVALDVFVHHWGSQTFQALDIDTQRLLEENFAKFRAKWGEERIAAYRLPSQPVQLLSAEVANAQAKLSLCMIVKNEEHHLPDCLRSVIDLVDEAIIVDTGSTDNTKAIAASFGAKVYDFPWVDSFAAARNESLHHAIGDFAFWMDADDRLDETNRQKLREVARSLRKNELVSYVMKCRCTSAMTGGDITVVDHLRLFPIHPDIRWRYRVHEQILPAIRQAGVNVIWADVAINHIGYQDPSLRGRKLERDLRLLLLDQTEQGDEPFILFNLGSIYQEQGRFPEAIQALQRSLEMSHPADSIVRKIYALLSHSHQRQGEMGLALAACRKGREFYPDDAELLFIEANYCQSAGDYETSVRLLEHLLSHKEGAHFASVDASLSNYKARHQLANAYRALGRNADALLQWELADGGRQSTTRSTSGTT